ncbi:transcriptional activator NhaR [Pseudohalioglobus sediminis]|uniref:Transcriptional activator NhaR n=1 Tax=Pseudohalioglobus sediminis TaxID=2606449 RepID=A0A5B0WXQ4_9GAMM|nr:transcriptional activator NhaR [Pseudohalioglobus sediminis]KAA1191842.1 transcriptional activator NhaR [Pseudohalioglobus sediminis]
MINYKHLHYFWVVAKRGGVARASETLHITPQTISGQIGLLEESLGEALFQKKGRNLELTEVGRMVMSYADEIFSLGGELEDAVRNMPATRPVTFKVGVADVVPKSIAYRLLSPALELEEPVRMVCRESSLDALLADLALHKIDMVIADGPIPAGVNVRGFNHALGECGVSFLAVRKLAKSLQPDFPRSLDGAPLLMPSDINMVQPRLLNWFDTQHVYPNIVGEFDDSALMKVFGQAGKGVFVAPSAIAEEICQQYAVEKVGSIDEVTEQFYAISLERRITHPAVAAITETARAWLS